MLLAEAVISAYNQIQGNKGEISILYFLWSRKLMPTSNCQPINDRLVALGEETGEDKGTIKDKCQLGSDSLEETACYFLMEPG